MSSEYEKSSLAQKLKHGIDNRNSKLLISSSRFLSSLALLPNPWFGVGTSGPGALFHSLQKQTLVVWRCELLRVRYTGTIMIPRPNPCLQEVLRKSQ